MKIKLTRGDTMYLTVDLGDYELEEGDTLTMTVKDSINAKNPLIQKIVTDTEIKIEPKDTSNLDYGNYVYDVQLNTKDGDVFTVVKPSLFRLTGEVTW